MLGVVKNFINSEKAVAVGLLVVAASVLAALGKMSIDQWIDYTKWMATVYVGGKSIQGAVAKISEARGHEAVAAEATLELEKLRTAADSAPES